MAKVLLKGLKEYFDAPDNEALKAAELKNDPTKGKESVKLGDHPCVMICEIKDIYLEGERVIKDGTEDKIVEYYKNRRKFIEADIEDKIRGAYPQFKFIWFIVSKTTIENSKEPERIKTGYEKMARKGYTENPKRVMLGLRFITEEYLKHRTLDHENVKNGDIPELPFFLRLGALRIGELAEITDKQNEPV